MPFAERAPHVPSRAVRLLAVAACLVCLALIALRLLDQLRPGNQDDKTLLYASSAVSPARLGAVAEVIAALPVVVAACPAETGHACRERTVTRVSSLLNYLALSATIRLARTVLEDSDLPPCERISLAYYAGILLLHGILLLLVVALVATDRSPDGTFSVLALLMLLAAAWPLDLPLLPAPHPAHAIGAYAPRSALAMVFLLQVAAFASGRRVAWMALSVLAPFVHAAQALLFAGVFLVALALRAALVPEDRAATVKLLAFQAVLVGLVLLAARSVAAPDAAASAFDAAGFLRVLGWRDAAWLAGATASIALARRLPRWGRPLLLLAAYLLVATLVNAAGGALGADPRSASGQLFLRFLGGSSFVVGMLPWLVPTLLVARAWTRVRPDARATTAGAAACVVLAVATAFVIGDRPAVAAAAERARRNVALARHDLCAITRCEHACRFRGFAAMRPGHETLFHLELFDYLDRWPGRR